MCNLAEVVNDFSVALFGHDGESAPVRVTAHGSCKNVAFCKWTKWANYPDKTTAVCPAIDVWGNHAESMWSVWASFYVASVVSLCMQKKSYAAGIFVNPIRRRPRQYRLALSGHATSLPRWLPLLELGLACGNFCFTSWLVICCVQRHGCCRQTRNDQLLVHVFIRRWIH